MGTYTEGRRLEGCAQQSLLVVEIGPLVLTTGVAKLARGQKTSRLSLTHVCCTGSLVFGFLEDLVVYVARSRMRNLGVVRENGRRSISFGNVAGVRNAQLLVM